jgi:hypothetical protein
LVSQKVFQPRKLYYVLGGQNAHDKRRLASRMDFIQVPRWLWLSHEFPDALIERAGNDQVCLSIGTTLISERRPFPQLSRSSKVDGELPGHCSAPNRWDLLSLRPIAISRRNDQDLIMAARCPLRGELPNQPFGSVFASRTTSASTVSAICWSAITDENSETV